MGKKKLFFQRNISIFPPNTFIGGIGLTINTPALLAAKLSCSESNVSNFEIIGNDVSCNIDVPYTFIDQAFYLNQEITSYIDGDRLVANLNSSNLFRGASNLVFVDFPVAIRATANHTNGNVPVFRDCVSLIDVKLDSLSHSEWNMFIGCTSLESVSFNSATQILQNSFDGCGNLKYINFPNVSFIDSAAFKNTTLLEGVTLPLLTSIDNSAFQYSGLTSFSAPLLDRLASNTFANTTRLNSVNLDAVTYMDRGSFIRSLNLQILHMPALRSLYSGSNTGTSTFRLSSIKEFNAPELHTITGNFVTYSACNINVWYTPKLTKLGDPSSNLSLYGLKSGSAITVDRAMETINNGSVHASIQYCITNKACTVTYIDN